MFTTSFFAPGSPTDGYAYQTIVTPDPYDGSPVCSILLLSLADHVVIQATVLYDVARDLIRAEQLRGQLVKGRIPPGRASDAVSDWLSPLI